jgi:hypothetical protein
MRAEFGNHDRERFLDPPMVHRPQTWFHYIGGNVSKAGITADLEAIAAAGLSGIQLFHGSGNLWPDTKVPITSLSNRWDDAVRHTAEECRRLGLRFTMQNCPGWAMSGGPWIEPENAMRHLAWSRTDADGGKMFAAILPRPQADDEPWRDYKDIAVLAFPTPDSDTGEPLQPQSVKGFPDNLPWKEYLTGAPGAPLKLDPAEEGRPHWVEVTLAGPAPLRTVEFPNVEGFAHPWCYEPGVRVAVQAVHPDGRVEEVLNADMPPGSWQDDRPISLACHEAKGVSTYRISISNKHSMRLDFIRLYSAARKNNWESEAGWTLRGIERAGSRPRQLPEAFVDPQTIIDMSGSMNAEGRLNRYLPRGRWTILRIGHVNTGQKNAPAPPEATGWECNKLSESGPNAHFAGYIGRLTQQGGALDGGLLNGMLLDSWECKTQTWTADMETEFVRAAGYELRRWLPAVFGYVVADHETTTRFLRDWSGVIGSLFSDKFYGRMARLGRENGLSITYETAAGDVFPADILEYFKHADVPMCEFWQPLSDSYTGSLNFKPIKPAASAARLYGKPRVAAEAFTSFSLTWDEQWAMLKEVANINCVEGVTHLVFHTYTHHPAVKQKPPGTSFGSGIGSPFLRGQTWWKHMPELTTYMARCSYMLERGMPESDVLWYLGDEINHKPDQNAPFPEGYKYDYCNPDALLNRLLTVNGRIVTPEGISYRLLWLPDNERMLLQTLEKLLLLVRSGAVIAGDAPRGIATLSGGEYVRQRFNAAASELFGDGSKGIRKVGAGTVILGMSIGEALRAANVEPDVTGGDALWLHRRTEGADWYFVTAPQGGGFNGKLSFRNTGKVEIWDPLTGRASAADARRDGARTLVSLSLPQAGSCFVTFNHGEEHVEARRLEGPSHQVRLASPWTISFPKGWGAPASLNVTELKAWKDLDMPAEARAFSGTATYTTNFNAGDIKPGESFNLNLGRVEMIAAVSLNGKPLRTLWAPPYEANITEAVRPGLNTLAVEVTGTWFNRLAYEAGLPESKRRTWTIRGPAKGSPLRDSGLLGPVTVTRQDAGADAAN